MSCTEIDPEMRICYRQAHRERGISRFRAMPAQILPQSLLNTFFGDDGLYENSLDNYFK